MSTVIKKNLNPHQINTRINYYLNSISPISTSRKDITYGVILEFFLILIFIALFKPYIIRELSTVSTLEVAFTSAFICSFFSWLYAINTNSINLKTWTYKKDIIRFYKRLLFVAIIYLTYAYVAFHYLYNSEIVLPVNGFTFNSLLYIFFIGTLIYFFSKFVDHLKFSAIEIKPKVIAENYIKLEESIIFFGKNKEEFVEARLSNILYTQSVGHYINFYLTYENTDEIKVETIRNSLNNIMNEVNKHANLFQCHRSFIVNLNKVKRIEGNSQKAKLVFINNNNSIPISRENYKCLKERYSFSEKGYSFNEKYYLETV
ncbi:MAG: hypothetical protein GQ540_01155 [Lutibacter sp.]|uniref:LytR/AlgR family response regulator transcription factor n=1 Tax=Lutibacter sp. TaxID=1925666 RepID=UPI001A04D50A|nr:LytTR family DNA-binding domain-containing protein [Lutibacter sp.]NOR27117.1 hypothetical protein [Lutibacter sp.]